MIDKKYLPYVEGLIELAISEDIGDGDHSGRTPWSNEIVG